MRNKILKNIKFSILLFGIITCIISCDSTANKINSQNVPSTYTNQITENDSKVDTVEQSILVPHKNIELLTKEFIQMLKSGKNVSSFFSENWVLNYHEDNRCTGSTDGKTESLASSQIDKVISMNVKNDGDGWACDKQSPKKYVFAFDLKKQVAKWDRFEIPGYEKKEKNVVYIVGAGESDLIKLHFNDSKMINKLEYRSEDPG